MAPTPDEELKLRLFNGETSQLGPAERFLKTMVDIPFAFKRLESLLFMCSVQEEVSFVKQSFANIEVFYYISNIRSLTNYLLMKFTIINFSAI